MGLPQETLQQIKENLDAAKASIDSLRKTLNNLRVAGIDASAQENQLNNLETEYRKMLMFYNLETKL
jgi:prefoldin subunit 5